MVRLMTGRTSHPLYKALPRSRVLSLAAPNAVKRVAQLSINDDSPIEQSYSDCIVCIGRKAVLSYFPVAQQLLEQKSCLPVDPDTCAVDQLDNVYAVGPLAGDAFVRFLIGGCFAAAKHILSR